MVRSETARQRQTIMRRLRSTWAATCGDQVIMRIGFKNPRVKRAWPQASGTPRPRPPGGQAGTGGARDDAGWQGGCWPEAGSAEMDAPHESAPLRPGRRRPCTGEALWRLHRAPRHGAAHPPWRLLCVPRTQRGGQVHHHRAAHRRVRPGLRPHPPARRGRGGQAPGHQTPPGRGARGAEPLRAAERAAVPHLLWAHVRAERRRGGRAGGGASRAPGAQVEGGLARGRVLQGHAAAAGHRRVAHPRAGAGAAGRALRGHRRAGRGRHPRAPARAEPAGRDAAAHHARAGDRRAAGHPRGRHPRREDAGSRHRGRAQGASRGGLAGVRLREAHLRAGRAQREAVLLWRRAPRRGRPPAPGVRVNRPAAPGFFRHLWLLWGLRLNIGLNQGSGRSPLLAVGAFLLSSAPAWGLGVTFYGLMRLPAVAQNDVWPFFILNLLCFTTAAVWVTWPLMSAGVDDHSELSRYAAFPISPFRLLIASTGASLLEPRALVFYAPLTGAALGYASMHPVRLKAFALLLYVLFALLNAAWSRVGLYVVLNVLREKHSAQLLGGGFVLFLVGASLIPPIDTSWLTAVGEGGVDKLDMAIIVDATLALGRGPPGLFGDALLELSYGYRHNALADGLGMLFFTVMGLGIAYALLLRFHRGVGRAGPVGKVAKDGDPFAHTRSRFTTLLVREALDLWRNPRARLLAAVPFVLAILLKLTSGRGLLEFAVGASADAWLMGGLCIYGAVVMASTFSQNTFAYDGHGLALLIAAPVELGDVLRAKNRGQGLAAGGMALPVGLV